mmetsp:Transcript_8419/g.12203  ORF Transcript_8419/g.12203 Transcript_8419/m.12203 type:complete len:173 (+) Transcript_8419:58-576(+)|eukprot:CAMPEP_0194213122 /NCGR_PEP_ID=MMETSP0156-20130528/13501_1 /TAXON_ID=33649 /ORGANISM="Thalassionema nitzschioides, Strain L26-B" /LENGTH=172 /DNA_ID=CAMNT_0038941089 /DNA_START=48 /DNA_END=566 /DNA_ORIENTATION=-
MSQTNSIREARAISPQPSKESSISQQQEVGYFGFVGGLTSFSSSDNSDVSPSATDVFRSKGSIDEEVFLVLKRANPINEYRDDYSDGACLDGIQSALKRHRISYDQRDDEEDTDSDSLSHGIPSLGSDSLEHDGNSQHFYIPAGRLSPESTKPNPFISKPVLIRNVTPRSED